jgi:hypothetical protein
VPRLTDSFALLGCSWLWVLAQVAKCIRHVKNVEEPKFRQMDQNMLDNDEDGELDDPADDIDVAADVDDLDVESSGSDTDEDEQ